MAWELRNGRDYYYYRAKKVNGRVVHAYFGAGERAQRAAAEDAQRRAEQQAQRDRMRAAAERWEPVEGFLAELERSSDQLLRAALLAAGFHQHKCGPWRRRRFF